MAKSILGKVNVKNSATAGERKTIAGLAGKFVGHIRADGNTPRGPLFKNWDGDCTNKDYGNTYTQTHWKENKEY